MVTGGSDELLRGYRLVTTSATATTASSSSSSSDQQQQHRVFLGNHNTYITTDGLCLSLAHHSTISLCSLYTLARSFCFLLHILCSSLVCSVLPCSALVWYGRRRRDGISVFWGCAKGRSSVCTLAGGLSTAGDERTGIPLLLPHPPSFTPPLHFSPSSSPSLLVPLPFTSLSLNSLLYLSYLSLISYIFLDYSCMFMFQRSHVP